MPRGAAISIGEISKPADRMLRLTNLHFDATDADIEAFFQGYGAIDWKRDINVKTGKQTVAYVLMNSSQELNRAIADLDYQLLLDRPVRVLRARGGFTLTDDGLLNAPQLEANEALVPVFEHAAPSASAFTPTPSFAADLGPSLPMTSYQSPAREDPESHYRSPYTPRHRAKSTPNDPRKRVLLLNNLHPEANESAVKLFFRDYNVIDFKRNRNRQNGKPLPVGFVLLGSIEERNLAKVELAGAKLMGRPVELEWANKGVKVYESGFEPPSGTDRDQFTPTKMPSAKRREAIRPPASASPIRRALLPPPPFGNEIWAVDQPAGMPSTSYDDAEFTAPFWQAGPWSLLRQASPRPQSLWDAQLAHRMLGPWNLAGKDGNEHGCNMITEEDWYFFQPREIAKHKREPRF